MTKISSILLCLFLMIGCSGSNHENADYVAFKAVDEIEMDGFANELSWSSARSYELDQRWLGEPYSEQDFSGSFKLSWDENHLYLLAEIRDDTLINQYEGLEQYWNEDILEVFIDEDASGGNHQYNYNAFAYHIDKNLDVIDIGADSAGHLYNDHINAQYSKNGDWYTWEVAIKIYDDSFVRQNKNKPVILENGKQMGFALAYCDNDTSAIRENFIGSEVIEDEDKNRGWIDAGVFGLLELRD